MAVLRRAAAARYRRRCRPTASRSWPWSTSPGPPGTSTSSRTRSSARSTAWGSARAGRSATGRSCPATSGWRMSHVVPDLVQKVLKGQDPLHILGSGDQVRHYTYGGDLAAGVVTAMEHEDALNEDFNLSTAEGTTVAQLAELIWRKVKGEGVALRLVHDDPFHTTSSAGYPIRRRRRRYSASKPPPPWTRCSTRSSPGSRPPSRPGPSEHDGPASLPSAASPWCPCRRDPCRTQPGGSCPDRPASQNISGHAREAGGSGRAGGGGPGGSATCASLSRCRCPLTARETCCRRGTCCTGTCCCTTGGCRTCPSTPPSCRSTC